MVSPNLCLLPLDLTVVLILRLLIPFASCWPYGFGAGKDWFVGICLAYASGFMCAIEHPLGSTDTPGWARVNCPYRPILTRACVTSQNRRGSHFRLPSTGPIVKLPSFGSKIRTFFTLKGEYLPIIFCWHFCKVSLSLPVTQCSFTKSSRLFISL